MSTDHSFHIGVNLFLVRDGKLLLGQRKNCFGEGDWGLPGGHLEFGENMQEGVRRELREETGLEIGAMRFSNLVNCPSGGKHYLQIGFIADEVTGEPEIKEPDRCAEWRWFSFDALPTNIFVAHQKQVQAFLAGNVPFVDAEEK